MEKAPVPINVLVVEDNAHTRLLFERFLKRLDCHATFCQSVERAVETLRRRVYHVVFCELCVRPEGGRGLARWIREHAPGTACYVVTGWKGELEQALLRRDGIHGVVRKPLNYNDIKAVVLDGTASDRQAPAASVAPDSEKK